MISLRRASPRTSTSEGKRTRTIHTLYSQLPTAADREAFEQLKGTIPNVATYPNTFAWFVLVQRFSDAARATWAGAQGAPAAKGGKTAAPAKKEEPAKKAAKADDDEMDLFGDDDEDDAVSIVCFFPLYLIGDLINNYRLLRLLLRPKRRRTPRPRSRLLPSPSHSSSSR